jgi:hypothetical protein
MNESDVYDKLKMCESARASALSKANALLDVTITAAAKE